jgi:hypothetical protein
MRVQGFDERHLVQEANGSNFVVFIYIGSTDPDDSWSVYSYLITEADLPEVLRWLIEELATDTFADLDMGTITCWSLGVVRQPARPTTESDLEIAWVVGSDVLNASPASRSSHEQRLADEMLARRHHITLLQQF